MEYVMEYYHIINLVRAATIGSSAGQMMMTTIRMQRSPLLLCKQTAQRHPRYPIIIQSFNRILFSTGPSSSSSSNAKRSASAHISSPSLPSPPPQQQHPSESQIFRHVLQYLWPKDDINTKLRVCGALSLLLGGKVMWMNMRLIAHLKIHISLIH